MRALALALLLGAVPASAAAPAAGPAPAAAEARDDARSLAARLQDKALAPEERKKLLGRLQALRDPRELPALFDLARSTATDKGTAQAAWSALVETCLDAPGAARAWLPKWLDNPDSEIRLHALSLLRQGVWDAKLTPRVRRLLLKDPDEEVRAEAAAALGSNEAVEARPDLLRATKDKSAAVRQAAAEALSALEAGDAE